MPGKTLNRGYPFPEYADAGDPKVALQNFAEAVDKDVAAFLATLPYRRTSLAQLNAIPNLLFGDRGIVTGATPATENGEYIYNGSVWKQQNEIMSATLQAGWNGNVQWVRAGSLITVSVNVGRTAGNFSIPGWTGTRLALGLPQPVPTFIAQAPVESNKYEYPAYSAQITSDGNIDLVARWVARDVDNGSWFRSQFTYREA